MLIFKAQTESITKKKFNGVDHLIVPVIALVEGVITSGNSGGVPQLALAEEFGNHPAGWNGRPVVVDHPQINGQSVSANIPEVVENEEIGKLFNTNLDDKKLKTEAWINLDIVKEKGGVIEETISRLENGEMVEISTGLFADTKDESGVHNNEAYNGVWENVVPDHLAILSEATGACSIEDGCGAPRTNTKESEEGEDEMHVHEDCECKTAPCSCEELKKDGGKRVNFLKTLSDFFALKKKSKMSDVDVRNALTAAVKIKNENAFIFLESVFDNSFIYQDGWDGNFFSQDFTIENDGSITLSDEVTQVRPEVEFIPVKVNNEEKTMDKEKFVSELIANEGTAFTSDDKSWLLELEDSRLEKLMPKANAEVPAEETPSEEPSETPAETPNEDEEDNVTANAAVSVEEYIASAPKELQEVLTNGLTLNNELRENMITGILANANNQFSEVDLKAFDIPTLKKLSNLAVVVNYEGRGGLRDHVTSDEDNITPPAPLVFEAK